MSKSSSKVFNETGRQALCKGRWTGEAVVSISETSCAVGDEMLLSQHSCKYEPPRALEEIDADLDVLSAEIIEMLREVHS
jgi:hypothetical protein